MKLPLAEYNTIGRSVCLHLKKFHDAVMQVTDLKEFIALSALINEMRTPKLKFQLIESQVKTYVEAMKQCQSYVTAFDICQAHESTKRKHDKRDQRPSNHPSKA